MEQEQGMGTAQAAGQLPQERQEAKGRAREEISAFAAAFPGVGPGQVPAEVWQEVRQGKSLAMAYALWRIRTLEDALAGRERSARLSAGSVSSAGSAVPTGTVAAFWDAYEL